jgi:phosphatidylglycerophosphate synthase
MLFARRDAFDRWGEKIGKTFSKLGISPNRWTLLSLIPVLVSVYFLASREFLLAALFFAISAFMDIIDGAVARYSKKVTKKGAYLDTILDRYVEFIIIIGLLLAHLPYLYLPTEIWILIFFFGAMMTTYAKAAAAEKGLGEVKGGLLERAERLIILFVGLLLATIDMIYLAEVIILLAVLANATAIQRMIKAWRS